MEDELQPWTKYSELTKTVQVELAIPYFQLRTKVIAPSSTLLDHYWSIGKQFRVIWSKLSDRKCESNVY